MTQGLVTILFTLAAVGWWVLFARMFRARSELTASALAWVAPVGASIGLAGAPLTTVPETDG